MPNQADDLSLHSYVADRHGYLRLSTLAHALHGDYITMPRP